MYILTPPAALHLLGEFASAARAGERRAGRAGSCARAPPFVKPPPSPPLPLLLLAGSCRAVGSGLSCGRAESSGELGLITSSSLHLPGCCDAGPGWLALPCCDLGPAGPLLAPCPAPLRQCAGLVPVPGCTRCPACLLPRAPAASP